MGELSYTVGGDSNLVSFKSAARVPITSLKAHFKPKQDLHGYSKPWPGGGGKNLFPYPYVETTKTENGITFTDLGDGQIKISGTNNGNSYAYFILRNDLDFGNIYNSFSTAAPSFVNGNYTLKFFGMMSGVGAEYYENGLTRFRITAGATVDTIVGPTIYKTSNELTSYEPYENICPIEGWNSAKIWLFSNNLMQVTPTTSVQYGMTWTADENGIVTYEGTPTSYAGVRYGKVYLNGRTKLYGRIFGDESNVAFNTLWVYDSSGTRIATISQSWENTTHTKYVTADLSNYPTASYVTIALKRFYDNVYMKGTCYAVVTDDPQYLQIPVTFPSTGKNLFNLDTATTDAFIRADNVSSENPLGQIVYDRQYYVASDFISVLPSTTYTAHHPFHSIASAAGMVYYDANKTPISGVSIYVQLLNNEENDNNYTFTTPDNCYYVRISYDSRTGNEFQLEQGDTTTAYESYSSNNTIYGGYVDLAAGEIIAEWAEIDLGSVEWSLRQDTSVRQAWYNNDIQVKPVSGSYTPINGYSDIFEPVGYSDTWKPYCIAPNTSGSTFSDIAICFEPGKYSSGSEVATAMSGIKFVYQLKTPIRYPISKQQLQAYINYNTALSNMNDITELSYAIHDTAPIRAAKKRIAAENDKHYRKVLWNQWAPVVNASNYRAYNSTNTTMTVEDDVIVQVWNKVVSGYSASICTADSWVKTHIMGRVYYLSYEYCTDFEGYIGGTVGGQTFFSSTLTEKNIWNRFSFIIRRTDGGGMNNSVVYMGRFNDTTGIEVGSQCLLRNPIAIDLTQMFGNGNEPKTKADFERLCAINNIDLYSYHPRDTGTEQMWCIPHATSDEYIKVNWNQQCKELTTSNYKPQNSNYASISAENGIMTTTILQDVSEVYQSSFVSNYSIAWDVSHKYYYKQEINSSTNSTYVLIYRSKWGRNQTLLPNTWTTLEGITSPESTDSTGIFLAYNADKAIGGITGASCQVRNPILIDLTKMFGVGNEPATVAELRETCLKNNINLDNAQPYISSTTIIWKK